MSVYKETCAACGDSYETTAWEPARCPFCEVEELKCKLVASERALDNARRELVSHREKAQGNYWAWQGDSEDHIESLVAACPVLIPSNSLLEILKGREASEQHEGFVDASDLDPTIKLLTDVATYFPEENQEILQEIERLTALQKGKK